MRNMYTQHPPLDDSMMDKWSTMEASLGGLYVSGVFANKVCDTSSCVRPPSVQPRISIKPIKRVCRTRQLLSIKDVEHLSEHCVCMCIIVMRIETQVVGSSRLHGYIICIIKGHSSRTAGCG